MADSLPSSDQISARFQQCWQNDFTVRISSFKEFFQEACLSLAAQLNLCPKYSQPFILLHNWDAIFHLSLLT